MTSTETLMLATLLEVFGERDETRRRTAIERTYHEDVVVSDPSGSVRGHDALSAKAQEILDGAPGLVFEADGPVHEQDDLGHLAWRLGIPGEPPAVRGMDIALIADGRIRRLYTFLLED